MHQHSVNVSNESDPVRDTDAPLLIVPGSHCVGRILENDIHDIVTQCGTVTYLAERGNAWIYSTPILLASDKALVPSRPRVLQIDLADFDLSGELTWLGV